MNVKILSTMVGRYKAGEVVEANAFEGGNAEVQRLVDLNAVAWCDEPANVVSVASMSAVAEMPDDELVAENLKLKELHKAKETKLAEVQKELANLKAELEALKPPPVADPFPLKKK